MRAAVVGREVPRGHALRRLEVWQLACVQVPEFRLQELSQTAQCAQDGRSPQDPRAATSACGANVKPHYTGNCRACQA